MYFRLPSPNDLSSPKFLLSMATECDRQAMFPGFSSICRLILLLPIGTADVGRSFSTMNRILCSERCRLTPDHVYHLMAIAVEGPELPDILEGDNEQMTILLNEAIDVWLSSSRRI